jgi:hypothetical protein
LSRDAFPDLSPAISDSDGETAVKDAGEVKVQMHGATYHAQWRTEGDTLHLSNQLGAKSGKLGAMAEQPETVARILLRELVMETGGDPD